MSRLPELQPHALSPEQTRIYEAIGATRRGRVSGPFGIWLRIPQLAGAASQLGNLLRGNGQLERRLVELIVLIVARRWSANYAWSVHQEYALEAGLEPEVVEAIRTHRLPTLRQEDEQIVYEVVTELLNMRRLSSPSYDRALAALGEPRLIELIATVGFYTMVGMTLSVFEVDARDGSRPLD
ncbi:MAG TPA: carboxymuconolactone decarboxylase family protein [Candidatus Binataceae bacterium]|nr:carboxymuconolactone decarboxylase family protein [Candidatus Binataceae bacterium]